MIRSPIHRVLLTFRKCGVRSLLMGGQACILYGGAEFSRDIDFTIRIDSGNLRAVRKALGLLKAENVFYPSFDREALERGHACHFRCAIKGLEGFRIDLMAKMRGCPDFDALWKRRSIVSLPGVGRIGVLSLADLVRAKKTQRGKDWPMIRRLVEADMAGTAGRVTKGKITFWLLECRTPALLVELAAEKKALCRSLVERRPLLAAALKADTGGLEFLLAEEEKEEKGKDREYWLPLRKELEEWRLGKHKMGEVSS